MRTITVVLLSLFVLTACIPATTAVPATASVATTATVPAAPATTIAPPTATPSPTATPAAEWGIAFAALDPNSIEYGPERPMTLYIIQPDGSGLRKLTNEIESVMNITADPNGHELLFSARLEETDNNGVVGPSDLPHLYRLDIQSGEIFTLTNGKTSMEWASVWSPDGNRIAFASSDVNSSSYIYVTESHTFLYLINRDGSAKTRVIEQEGNIYSIAWSPSGDQIAFEQNGAVWVVNPNGSNLLKVADAPIQYGLDIYTAHPVWSPDEHRIAFAAPGVGEEQEPDIFIVNSDGSNLVNITQSQGQDFQPVWSPDGRYLAYISNNWDIYTSAVDGSNAVMLSDDTSPESNSPIWSPDGSQLVFVTGRTWTASTQLFIADWPGGAPHQLNGDIIVGDRPTWALFPSH